MSRDGLAALMAGYDRAMWLWSENIRPEIVLVVQVETASDAVKVAVSAGDSRIHGWYGVTTLAVGFGFQRATAIPAESMKMSGWLCCMQNKRG